MMRIGISIVEVEAEPVLISRPYHIVVADDLQGAGALIDIETVLVGQGEFQTGFDVIGELDRIRPAIVLSGCSHRVIFK